MSSHRRESPVEGETSSFIILSSKLKIRLKARKLIHFPDQKNPNPSLESKSNKSQHQDSYWHFIALHKMWTAYLQNGEKNSTFLIRVHCVFYSGVSVLWECDSSSWKSTFHLLFGNSETTHLWKHHLEALPFSWISILLTETNQIRCWQRGSCLTCIHVKAFTAL